MAEPGLAAATRLHADFTRRAVVHEAALQPWQPSPLPGVERCLLERIGGEIARATSLVRYAPGSRFAPHVHGGGEEFLVLEGVFEDEHGAHPAGTYVRNPPGTRHAPASPAGCVIFVKLWQFAAGDARPVRIDTRGLAAPPAQARARLALHTHGAEAVHLEAWRAGAQVELEAGGGVELFVVAGTLAAAGARLGLHGWLREPPGAPLRAAAGAEGARVWVKRGHLRPPVPVPG